MTNLRSSLQNKALASVLTTLAVVLGVTWGWREEGHNLAMGATGVSATKDAVVELSGLELPARVDETMRPSSLVRTVVVRSGSNLRAADGVESVVKHAVAAGVKRVWLQFKQDETDEFTGGEVFYPSKIAPVAEGFEDGRLLRCAKALKAAGIEVMAWLPAFHDPAAWEENVDWRAEKVLADGSVEVQPNWLCPRCPEAVEYEASLLAEVGKMAGQELSGVYTDFIRYDNDFSCVCPRCLNELTEQQETPVVAADIRTAASARNGLWKAWVQQRAEGVRDALNEMRDALNETVPDLWFGASVLPFSAVSYEMNTQSGQNLGLMCRAGIDEIVLMGYWDDWEKSPEWLADSIKHAQQLVGKEAKLSCLLDADMSVHRTMKTLDAVATLGCDLAWFNYRAWQPQVYADLQQACLRREHLGGTPKAPFTAVVLRVDTEPDSDLRYDTLKPEMISQLTDLFTREKVPATFVTCGRLAELQPEAVLAARTAGFEIAGHGYNHEQIDSLLEPEQRMVVHRMEGAFTNLGIRLRGFGAPRNSITDAARDELINLGLAYDGSQSYDPMVAYEDPQIIAHSEDPRRGIVLVPFIVPNDYDARFVMKLSAEEMFEAWRKRLDRVVAQGESCFVLDVHQWLITQPDNFAAFVKFIHDVKSRPECRFLSLLETSRQVLGEIQRTEGRLAARP